MSAQERMCGTCGSIRRTSADQVFLRCDFWSAPTASVPGAFVQFGHDYVITHCHVSPEQMACPFWTKGTEVSHV